ncbi:hypothetical protein D3C78_1888970 [compost metagenome]
MTGLQASRGDGQDEDDDELGQAQAFPEGERIAFQQRQAFAATLGIRRMPQRMGELRQLGRARGRVGVQGTA